MHTMFFFPPEVIFSPREVLCFSCALTPHSSIRGGEWHEPRMLSGTSSQWWPHQQIKQDPRRGTTGYQKSKLAEIPLAKNIRILFTTKIQLLEDWILSKTYQNCVQMYTWSFKSLKDHTRGTCTLIMSLAQIYQCYIQGWILTCRNHKDHQLAILILIN